MVIEDTLGNVLCRIFQVAGAFSHQERNNVYDDSISCWGCKYSENSRKVNLLNQGETIVFFKNFETTKRYLFFNIFFEILFGNMKSILRRKLIFFQIPNRDQSERTCGEIES